jgi:protocatechuate 3,4-dioxygenase beta subunit
VVLLADGTPARDARVNIGTWLNGMSASAGAAVTDSSGQFSFGAIEGFEYALDIQTPEGRMAHNVRFSSADSGQPITINLLRR